MKRIAFSAVIVAFFASSLAFAATPTTEPALPSDIDSWIVVSRDTCKKHTNKSIVVTLHTKNDGGFRRQIRVMTLNGQKIYQIESARKLNDYSPAGSFSYVYYVRNSREKNWLAYEWSEVASGDARVIAELGLEPLQSPC
jgi:hypothetical protein